MLIDRMGGSSIEDDWDFTPLSNAARTVVLVGRTGNGKSATANSILGRKAFKSRISLSGVTTTSELQSTVLKDGHVVNVIDTPGLFDISAEAEFLGKEIVKCIDLAKDGIHAVIIVFSVRRFSKEEEAAVTTLQTFFGPKITDYMIVVFTGGDEFEGTGETFEDFLGDECPEQVQKILDVCKKRCVLFNNKTKDKAKNAEQVQHLLDLVDMVIEENGGRPYTDDLFKELQRKASKLRRQEKDVDSSGCTIQEISELKEQMHQSYDEQLKRITEMVEVRLRETTSRLEQQLAAEHAARLKAEEAAHAERLKAQKMSQAAQQKSSDEIRRLREDLERARKETEELRNKCVIL